MALVIDASTASTTSAPNTCVTASLNTTGATLLVMAITGYDWNNRVEGLMTPFDSKGNTWTGLTKKVVGTDTGSGIRIWYVNSASPTVGSGHTFTAGSNGDSSYPVLFVWAFDSTGASPFSAESGQTAGSSPTSIQEAASVGSNGQIAVCAVNNNLGTGTSQSINSSFNITGSKYGFVGSTHGAGAGGYLLLSGAVQPTWSSLDGSDAETVIAIFGTASGGGGAAQNLLTCLGVGS